MEAPARLHIVERTLFLDAVIAQQVV
jgi:hypothetical protein